ncbi:MAG: M20/M25/M40 family metallo-hydrolase [Candidatus Aminicenantia bacterium]
MKILRYLLFIFLIPFFVKPCFTEDYNEIAKKILKKGLEESRAYTILEELTRIGPRLTGSPQANFAVELMKQLMIEMGLNVKLEPVEVSRWIRGEKEEGRIISNFFGQHPISISALGGSISTPEDGILAEVVEVKSLEELKRLGEEVKGKIVFFNKRMEPSYLDPFRSYGECVWQRVKGASEASRFGASAVIVRSMTISIDEFPHTGIMRYSTDAKKIPAVSISTKDAELLSKFLKKDPSLKIYIKTNCRELPPVISYNVIGSIKGIEKPEEIVLIGAHLDSWDLGEGAHDDGAGCAHVVEALRLIKELGLKPKRTIRGVLFMDEETGGTGGKIYSISKERENENHIFALESDRGGFTPYYFGISGSSEAINKLKKWEKILGIVGIKGIREGGGGTDIGFLEKKGAILSTLITDPNRYFDYHHCERDVLSAVHPRELELGAVAIALFSYIIATEGI